MEVGVNLAVRSEEARTQAFEGSAHRGFVVKMSLEFKVENLHRCKASLGQRRGTLPDCRQQLRGKLSAAGDPEAAMGTEWKATLILSLRPLQGKQNCALGVTRSM